MLYYLYHCQVQDFLECEILLLIAVCSNKNGLFLTGGTAQTIARGLSFRFCDVTSLFWQVRQQELARHGKSTMEVPSQIYKLLNNYRTHSGILNLANAIIDIIVHFFPNSVDKLEHDRGLFTGPKPWLLEAATFDDLCILLLGSDRDSQIEFGSQQCIIVRDEDSKTKIPVELSRGGRCRAVTS